MSNSLRNQPNKNKTSCDIRGVTWSKDKKKWSVHIMHKSKNYFLGYYELLNDAGYIRKQAEEAVKNNVFDEWYARYKESKR